MYQLWERTLRSFLEGEMRRWMGAAAREAAWKPNNDGIFQLLASGTMQSCSSYPEGRPWNDIAECAKRIA
jgi:hypothetical protein